MERYSNSSHKSKLFKLLSSTLLMGFMSGTISIVGSQEILAQTTPQSPATKTPESVNVPAKPQPTVEKPQSQPTAKNQTNQSQAMTHMQQGVEKYEQGKFKEAVNNYSKAIQLDQNYAIAYLNRGYTYSILGKNQARSRITPKSFNSIPLKSSWPRFI